MITGNSSRYFAKGTPWTLLFALFVCAGCAGNRVAQTVSAAQPVNPVTQMAALEQRIFDIVQDERHKINPAAKPLALDSELMGVARRRSADMAQKNYIAHKGPDGQTSANLIMDADQDFQGLLGENLASQPFIRQSGVNIDTSAERFVNSWLGSPQNKENLSFAGYDRSAVGAAVGGDTIYVTQLFAANLGLKTQTRDPKKRQVTEWKDPGSAAASPKQTEHAPQRAGAPP